MTAHTFYLDDVDIRKYGFMLERGHSNPALVQARERIEYIPGRPGALYFGDDSSPIAFDLPIFTLQDNPYELQAKVRTLKSLFIDSRGKRKNVKLRFGYEPDKYYNVRAVDDLPIRRLLANNGAMTLSLVCYDGYAHSVAASNEITWGSNVIPFTSDYTMGHTGDGSRTFSRSGNTVITVTGDNLKPIIHVSGTGTNVSIKWGSQTLTLGTFTNATWLIDLEEYTILKNGKLAIHEVKGDWISMELVPGENLVTVSGTGLNLNVSFAFRDKWVG